VPIGDYEVQALFAEPIFRMGMGNVITDKQVEFIKNLKMVRNPTNLISENKYIFELPELRSIKDGVQEALDVFAKEIMGIPQRLYVTQSWSLMNEPSAGMHTHAHSNSVVSGSLYFCEMPNPPARMIFHRHRTHQQIDLQPEKALTNIYNAPVNVITPQRNEVVLFASDLTHMVESNGAGAPRYSIAFNTFVRGKLGGYRNVSELVLT
jgi:uncharacterized protein (TIGR02466 family)